MTRCNDLIEEAFLLYAKFVNSRKDKQMFQIPLSCTGCYACVNICLAKCIKMKQSETGFHTPKIDQALCINCGQCEKVCPVIHMPELSTRTVAYAMKNRDQHERSKSTSGGIFPLLAEYVLDREGVIFGAVHDSDFSVRHIKVCERKDLSLLQGAKYVQSVIGTAFLEVKRELVSGRIVLFSGTPCQCAGLRSFLGKLYENLITVDIICHGVPSPKVWQAYVDYRSQKENAGKRPIKINMRSKSSGWSHYGYSTEFDYGDGKISQVGNRYDLFMKAFVGNICLRSSCSDCKTKGVERCTDFTLGDYWGIWNQHPEFDDNKGTSVVFVHTQKGREILEQLSDKMDCLKVDIEDAYKENGSLVNSSPAHSGRDEFLEQITADNFEDLVKKYFPQESVQKSGLLQRIKRKLEKIF